jgi:hypothetical protein
MLLGSDRLTHSGAPGLSVVAVGDGVSQRQIQRHALTQRGQRLERAVDLLPTGACRAIGTPWRVMVMTSPCCAWTSNSDSRVLASNRATLDVISLF